MMTTETNEAVAENRETPSVLSADSPRWLKPAIALSVLAVILVYALRIDRVIGLTVDDAWYVLLAKGLATGQGYAVFNSPTPGILPLYPPAFPFVLSWVYRVFPHFPQNVWALKLVSIAAMLGASCLCYWYFTRTRKVSAGYALLLSVSLALSPPLVFLATSTVMSECFFTLVLMAAIVAAERVTESERGGGSSATRWVVACAGLVALGFLTRSIAAALVVGIFFYFLKEKFFRQVVLYTAVVTLLALPWVIYSRVKAPTDENIREQAGQIVMSYDKQFWQRIAAMTGSDQITVADIPDRVANNLLEIAGRDVLHVATAPLFEKLRDPYKDAQRLFAKEAAGKQGDKTEGIIWFSLFLSIFVVVGYIAAWRERCTSVELAVPLMILIIALWPWETIRFVLPMSAFILFYLSKGVQVIVELAARQIKPGFNAAPVASLVLVVFLAINVFGHASYISKKMSGNTSQWLKTFDAVESMMAWAKTNIPAQENVIALNPALVHLYTGHKTIAWENPKVRWYVMRKWNIRYFVRFAGYPIPEEPELGNYQTVMQAPDAWGKIIDFGPEATRLTWGAEAPKP